MSTERRNIVKFRRVIEGCVTTLYLYSSFLLRDSQEGDQE